MSRERRRARGVGVLLGLAGVTLGWVLVVALRRGDASPAAVVVIVGLIVVAGAATVVAWSAEGGRGRAGGRRALRADAVLTVAMAVVVVALGLGCLLAPASFVTTGYLGPRSVGAARVLGAVILTGVAVVGIGALRRRGPSDE